METKGSAIDADAQLFEDVLGSALESGELVDAAIAKSEAEREAMWGQRDDSSAYGRKR